MIYISPEIYEYLNNQDIFTDDSTIEEPKSENGSCFFGGKKEITHHPEFIKILEHPNSFHFFTFKIGN